MNQTIYKVVKLTNGEDIICKLSDGTINGKYEIGYPLRLEVVSHATETGLVESLNLSRWMAPYTEKISLNASINDEDIYDELLEDLEPESDLIH